MKPQSGPTVDPSPPAQITETVKDIEFQLIEDTWKLVDVGEFEYDLLLIPGDPDRGIAPFYFGKTEVTWEMFHDWSYATDLDSRDLSEAILADMRPSPLYGDTPQMRMGLGRRPAIGMSWRTARAYCAWLSEKTGRTYRLPTDTEWQHVLRLSGGVPKDRKTLLAQAVLEDNAELDDIMLFTITAEVASKKPNKLGLYDFLGNAAEWVQPEDGKRWVRGGHFMLKANDLSSGWQAIEDQAVWNENYPQIPPSRFWYLDHYYQGLRLVCEVEGAPSKQ